MPKKIIRCSPKASVLDMLYIVFLIAHLLSHSSCSLDKYQSNTYNFNLLEFSVAKEIHLPLDTATPPLIGYFQVLHRETDSLKYLIYNRFNKTLYFYDFKNEKLDKKVALAYKKGKIPDINAFYYLNKDSILLFPEYGDFYFICDETGMINSKSSFVDEDDAQRIESHWITASNPLIKMNNYIYINNVFGWIAKEGEEDKFLLIEHNLKDGSSRFMIQHPSSVYDKNFDNSTFRHLGFTWKRAEPILIYSFNFDPYIYEYNSNQNSITKHYCAPEGYRLPPKVRSGEDLWIHFQTNHSFSKMEYDDFRKVLIRVALLPYDMDDIKAGITNPEDPKKPMIYLFDAQYNLMGGFVLDKSKQYYFTNIFTTQDGIWIQKITDNENLMSFELIQYKL
ncbi:MAG TPA: hypothetical protein PKC76_11415 [Saprospiraceae bacterium]|nr:hypothetical protein [Saprospiraceae bacterium]HMP24735.1 hypothetical protein [Saprospiraceae bacterium]